MRPAAKDLIAIVEAAYRLDVPDHEWLEGIASACRPILDEGFGLSAFEFHYQIGSSPKILQAKRIGMSEELEQEYPAAFANMGLHAQQRALLHGPCTSASQIMGLRRSLGSSELMPPFAQKYGIRDSIWVTALEPSGWGCGLHAGRSRMGWPSRVNVDRWSRVAAHLSAAVRLRRRLARDAPTNLPATGANEAILSPDGRVHQAEGAASTPESIEMLRRSVLDLEAARSARHEDGGETCLSMWKGLVEGRWSLIDQFENDGKRYVVAKENAPAPPEIEALTLRERQILGYAALGHTNKVIAYDLGIAHATVKVFMARAASKLGAQSRAELISIYRDISSGPSAATPSD